MAFGSKKNKEKAQTADSQEVQDSSKVRANRAFQKRRAGKPGSDFRDLEICPKVVGQWISTL
jgi:hypothetical protein